MCNNNSPVRTLSLSTSPKATFLERIDGFKTVWCGDHHLLSTIGNIKQVKTKPMWIAIVHSLNVLNKVSIHNMRVPIKSLGEDFSINYLYRAYSEKCFTIMTFERQKFNCITDKYWALLRCYVNQFTQKCLEKADFI